MLDLISGPWPWYVAGPLIGAMVPVFLILGNRGFGVSSNFRHACAAVAPVRPDFLRYDWRRAGGWNLVFALGILAGGYIAAFVIGHPDTVAISPATQRDLAALGITETTGFVPSQIFAFEAMLSWRGFAFLILGGFLVGFGTAYAGGCTSGHGVAGLANFQLASLIAVIGFFTGGLLGTFLLLPLLL
jgi:uncharacterized protein